MVDPEYVKRVGEMFVQQADEYVESRDRLRGTEASLRACDARVRALLAELYGALSGGQSLDKPFRLPPVPRNGDE